MSLNIHEAALPKRNETYVKTITAFANTSDGTLIIEIDDSTRPVIGMDKDLMFRIMDSITNAISDNYGPQIVPNISFQTIGGKCIVMTEIYADTSRPYYLKHTDKENGTCIRVAGISRQVDAVKPKELELEGTYASRDKQICIGYEVKEDTIDKLCQGIYRYMKSAIDPSEGKRSIAVIAVEHLPNWKLLKENGNQLLATNSLVLFTGDYF